MISALVLESNCIDSVQYCEKSQKQIYCSSEKISDTTACFKSLYYE